MDQTSATSAARRSEDIALDLLKFLAPHANLGSGGKSTPGFAAPSAARSEDHITQLLELYARCRAAVDAK